MTNLAEKYDFITVKEFAAMMRVSHMTVHRLLNAGEIRHYRIGDAIRIKRQDALDYIHNSAVRPTTEDD